MKKILLFVILFLSFINSIYCENYLYGSKGSTTLLHWPSNSVHYRVHIDGAGDNGLNYQATSDLIQAAYSAWNNVSTKAIWFYYDGSVSGSESAIDGVNGHYWVYPPHSLFNNIFYDNPNTPDVVEGASALTIIEDTDYIITDVDIVYNGLKEWRGDNYMTWWNEVESVAIHEIGHSFGLAHATAGMSPIPVMTYAADPSSNRRELKFDDRKGISFLYGGNLIDNETFSGTDTYMWNLTVASGTTLTIQSGSTINFQNGVSLTINGTLNAQGSSASRITFNSTSGTWGGIQFNSGSNGNLQYCNIQYANNGIYCYNSSPTIKYSTLDNNGTAGYCDYYSSPQITYSNFRYNSNDGVRCNSYSSPSLLNYGYPGYNVIRNNSRYGVYASYNSNPTLGGSYGLNSIYSNSSCEVLAEYNCYVLAQNAWWGSNPPVPYEFCMTNSTINYSNWLTSDPNPGRLVVENNNAQTNGISLSIQGGGDELEIALTIQREKKYNEAIPLFLETFKKNKENHIGRYALIKIEECFSQSGKRDYLEYSKKEIKSLLKEGTETFVVALELETHQMVILGLYKEAINNLQMILKKYKLNESIEKNTLFRLGAFYIHFYDDEERAEEYFTELRRKYPNDELLGQIEIVEGFGKTTNKTEQSINLFSLEETVKETTESTSEEILSNYPNPFNPTTKISYHLPEASFVTLKVYDILGREIVTLVNEVKPSGKYEVEFNASELPSGTYVYKLTAGNYQTMRKMLLIK